MAKNVIVTFDGTNQEYARNNTNVMRVFEAIVRDNTQVAFYDPGVGTFSIFGRRLGRRIGSLLGSAAGYGVRKNIEDGYRYLLETFEEGDLVFIFGFSRGAYTARALAGMIHQLGILRKGSENLIPYVSKLYFHKEAEKDHRVVAGFKETFSVPCKPHLLGVWDTVGALGLMLSKRFPHLRLNHDIANAYQAMSIDEKRWAFRVMLFDVAGKPAKQKIEQVWFAGAHSDVGGGCDRTERQLSDVALSWMLDKAESCGLKLKTDWRKPLIPDPLGPSHASWRAWLKWIVPIRRRVPAGAMVHQSVIDRRNGKPGYRPLLPEDHRVVSNPTYDAHVKPDAD
jgi:uncharacterized protein (DUF2235 family)